MIENYGFCWALVIACALFGMALVAFALARTGQLDRMVEDDGEWL